ncbi:MAG TPA: phosphatidylglycerophosphatase A [Methylomirabilota bacterium]|nr:phosphatidylglycerophosphatase A [Methylomirabilota bacterium]
MAPVDNASRTAVNRVALLIATVAGVGYAPVAPGTVASALTVVVLGLVAPPPGPLLLFVIVVIVVGTWAAHDAERSLGGKDPGVIVIDEVAGMALSVLTLPLTPLVLLAGFLLFRVFDIVKPYPANALQRLRGGVGVMLDDLVAGLYALVLLVAARALLGWP